MIIGGKEFKENKTHIMGILNVTPDSFSDGGRYSNIDAALIHAERMIKEGAVLIDIGGESTRPGYTMISDEEEIERVVPVIEAVKKNFDIGVSLDTYKSAVAYEGISAGADLINDIWGLMWDPRMAEVIAKSGVTCCLMHNRRAHDYLNFAEDFIVDMSQILDKAVKAGIPTEKIMLDPGVGFAKTYEENLWVLNNMDLLKHLGVPYLLGASRKSVIGNTLNLPVEDRVEGTLALTALAFMKDAFFVRVHDVKENKRVLDMLEAVKNAG